MLLPTDSSHQNTYGFRSRTDFQYYHTFANILQVSAVFKNIGPLCRIINNANIVTQSKQNLPTIRFPPYSKNNYFLVFNNAPNFYFNELYGFFLAALWRFFIQGTCGKQISSWPPMYRYSTPTEKKAETSIENRSYFTCWMSVQNQCLIWLLVIVFTVIDVSPLGSLPVSLAVVQW